MNARYVAAALAGAVLTAAAVLGAGWGTPAAAHATLESTSPADGAEVDAVPETIELTFSEEMSAPAYVVVTAPDGTTITTGDPDVAGAEITQPLENTEARGTYTVAFRVFSADAHPVSGQFAFHLGEQSGPTPTAADQHTDRSGTDHDTASGATSNAPKNTAAAPSDAGRTWRLHYLIGATLLATATLLWWLSRPRPT